MLVIAEWPLGLQQYPPSQEGELFAGKKEKEST